MTGYTAITIADQLLRIAKKKGKELTPLQLMKLVYISHGWSFPLRGRDLFNDTIEAWKYGPVIPSLYHATKHFGRNAIPASNVGDADAKVVDDETYRFLESVFDQYGHLDGIALSTLTHQYGTPWDQVFRRGYYNAEIPDTLIKQHYHELYRARRPRATIDT